MENGRGTDCTFRVGDAHAFGGFRDRLVSRRLDVLSPVKLGINRPNSGADHRNRGTQASQHDGDQWIFQRREEYPDLDNGDRDSGERRPQAK